MKTWGRYWPVLLVVSAVHAADCFAPRHIRRQPGGMGWQRRQQHHPNQPRAILASTSTSRAPTKLAAKSRGIDFAGDSSESLFVPHPDVPSTGQPNPERTLPAFLRSSSAVSKLLGTDNFSQRDDGLWEAYQPEIGWFGLNLAPVFVNDIGVVGPNEAVVVDIKEARTDIAGGRPPGNRAKAIAQIMERSTFEGRYELLHEEVKSRRGKGWSLSGDLTLVLRVPLPRLVPLPPGFNTIGSRIVRSTCRRRVEDQLSELRDAYIQWAQEEGGP